MSWWWKWIVGTGIIVAGGIAADFARAEPQLCWQKPTENTDGTQISDLRTVRLHWGAATRDYTSTLDVPTSLPGDEVCTMLNLAPGTYHFAATAIAYGGQTVSGMPVTLTGTAPESQTVSVGLSKEGDPIELRMVVNDADQADEGTLTIGSWSVTLFQGQVGADQVDHEVIYAVPRSAFQESGSTDLVFEHTSTAGYEVRSLELFGLSESAYSNEVIKTVEAAPTPPVIPVAPDCPTCTSVTTSLVVTQTGDLVSLQWEALDPAPENVEVEVLEYPPETGALPLARAVLDGTATVYGWTPSRSGLYYSRMRTCSAGSCSDWSNSHEQGYVYYAELAPASGGGIN